MGLLQALAIPPDLRLGRLLLSAEQYKKLQAWRKTPAGLASTRAASAKFSKTPAGLAIKKKSRDSLFRRRRDLVAFLKAVPCADCGASYHTCVMDFDHVRGNKSANVSKMLAMSPDKILAEVAKCEVVCANCHRMRTMMRRLQQG